MIERRDNLTPTQQILWREIERVQREMHLSPDALAAVVQRLAKQYKNQILKEKAERRAEKRRKEKEDREAMAEHVKEVTSMELPLDYENAFFTDDRAQGVHADTPADGLVYSLTRLGRVDVEYISAITGYAHRDVIAALKGSIYQNPETWQECFYKGWETADEYLTGNLIRKWRAAKDADMKYDGYFRDNLAAIESVLPAPIATDDIFITLGSPWVPTDVIDDFILHILGPCSLSGNPLAKVKHDELTGTWEIPYKNRYMNNYRSYAQYGTRRLEALHILERTLNLKSVSIKDEVVSGVTKSGVKRVLNKSETTSAIEKQKKMIDEFRSWVWKDEERKKRLVEIFEEKFTSYRRRRYDGTFLTFPGMNENVTLFPYQKNAIARILFSKNTLLAHDVGAGKTYIMIAAGMELKRMGLSKKNLYVVPNNIVGQWKSLFTLLYPDARVLVVDPRSFAPAKRLSVLESIRDDDYDAILMAQSCFDLIPISEQYRKDQLQVKKDMIDALVRSAGSKLTVALVKEKEKVSKALQEAMDIIFVGEHVFFDELEIDRLFVDEAHNYKNLPIQTHIDHVLGISETGSKKCAAMLDKVAFTQRRNGGGGVVMATGTPITNSVTDIYVFQKYLQSGELALLDLQTFDAWVGTFAERATEFEIDVDTNGYRLATRLSRFHNLPELTALLSSVADFHRMDKESGLPDFDGYTDAVIPRTQELSGYLEYLSARADTVRNGNVSRKEDNMLKITTDGRKAALDLRLVDPTMAFTWQSKVARCAENVADIYRKTAKQACTQLVFCDSSTPKEGFNVYDELTRLLVAMGVDLADIAYVHDADTEKKRDALFRSMQQGRIRVLLGSTFKLGLGVNVQNKLVALHHLDVPWRPADMVQREGRLLRPGNENERVYIFRYVTEGSFDAYSWQLLETKQRFIAALLSGSWEERSGSDVDGTALSYAEVKALAVGNPLLKTRVETANELARLISLQQKTVENREFLQQRLAALPAEIEDEEKRASDMKGDIDFLKSHVTVETKEDRKETRERIFTALQENVLAPEERELLTYRGFTVILPTNMIKEKPFVYLYRVRRYNVDMGDTDVGILTRIDNYLEGMPDRLARVEEKANNLRAEKERIETALGEQDSYADKIAEVRDRLKKIDEQLNV